MKKILWRSFISLLWMIIPVSAVFADTQPSLDVAQLQSGRQVLRVGHIAQLPPFFMTSRREQVRGLDVDIVKEVSRRAGIPRIEFLAFNDYPSLNQALQAGQIDMIVSDYWVIPNSRYANNHNYLYTIPYYRLGGIAVAYLSDHVPFNNLGDLRNRRVGTLQSSGDITQWFVRQQPNAKLVVYNTPGELMAALYNGQIDAAVGYYTYFRIAHHKNHNVQVALVQPLDSVYVLRRQDGQLQQQLNQAIDSMWRDRSLNRMQKQYLGPVGTEPPATVLR